ncbi:MULTISPECIES: cytochrome P450 [Microbacterium]|uniref:cytochrome P450 n=1 Tax=Microbacterium TaxID=33882 RepID=UPI0023DA2E1E|nr:MULTISPECIES: cytochrome P450 [Microbacterium]MDF2046463.1 cytochrome P450 [Microbacterium sp. Kw_RZR3]MDQ1075870.1 cholest-4-en-3-one 26-monooxygenase [Microbacterium sp. SORGH_AS_0969]MDQ1116115.1 cholest-4-en-3-one 26-monooxygenase [Microbacterium testaceum]
MTDWHAIDNKLLDPHWYTTREYHDVFKTMRDEDPVHWTENERYGRPHWSITRYDDVKDYLLRDDLFSNRWDTRVTRSPKRRTPEERHAQGWDINPATNDNPVHDLYRAPINKHFSVPAIGRLGSDVSGIVDEIIADVAERGECDLVEDIAAELPVKVILRMLGVPESDWPYLREASWQWLASADPRWVIDNDPVATYNVGMGKLLDYCQDLAIARRKDPKDDFATVIGQLQIDGDELSIHEMRMWFTTMIGGGLETTRNAAAVGLWAFMLNPDQRTALLDDPSLTKPAIEEVLRWATPTKSRLRVATRDFDLNGKRIKTGDWAVGFLASANKDETVFPDPHRFDITRTPNDHLAFGTGIHLCLGRALARLELASLIPRVLQTFPDLRPVSDAEPNWIADYGVNGFTSMQVAYTSVSSAVSAR